MIELFIINSLLSEINISIRNHWQPLFNFETNLPFCSHFFHHQALRHQVIVRNWLLACFSSSGNYIQILGHKILWFKQVEQPTQSEKNFGGSLTIEQYIWQHNYHHHCCNNITISHRPAQQKKVLKTSIYCSQRNLLQQNHQASAWFCWCSLPFDQIIL